MTNSNIQELSLQELESLQGGKVNWACVVSVASVGVIAVGAVVAPPVTLAAIGFTTLGWGLGWAGVALSC